MRIKSLVFFKQCLIGACAFLLVGLLGTWLMSCNRDYTTNPYLSSKDTTFTEDKNHDGVADSVAKYFPNCKLTPQKCLDSALAIKKSQSNNLTVPLDSVHADDLYLVVGEVQAPNLHFYPDSVSDKSYSLLLSFSPAVKINKITSQVEANAVGESMIYFLTHNTLDSFMVYVSAATIPLDTIQAPNAAIYLEDSTAFMPSLTFIPDNTTERDYILKPKSTTIVKKSADQMGLNPLSVGKDSVEIWVNNARKGIFEVTVSKKDTSIHVTSVIPSELNIKVNEILKPTLLWLPSGAIDKNYTLSIANATGQQIVSITADKQSVKGLAEGNATVTVQSTDRPSIKSTFNVRVSPTLLGITVNPLSLIVGDSSIPTIQWNPVSLTSSEYFLDTVGTKTKRAVTLSADRKKVIAIAAGVDTIKVTAISDTSKYAFMVITVKTATISPTSIVIVSTDTLYSDTGVTWTPNVTVKPIGAPQAYGLSSNLSAVYINDKTLRPQPDSVGVGEVWAYSLVDNNIRAKCTLTVLAHVKGIAVANLILTEGGSDTLPLITVSPKTATNNGILLETADTNFVEIISGVGGTNQKIRPKSVGTATIQATAMDGSKTYKKFTVTVKPIVKVTSFTLSNAFNVYLGETGKPTVIALPTDATNKSYRLVSYDSSIVKVGENGLTLTGLKEDSAYFVIQALDGGGAQNAFKARVRVHVQSVSAPDMKILVNDTVPVAPNLTWNPTSAFNKHFTLISDDSTSVKVLGERLVGTKPGHANITLTTNDLGKTTIFRVDVIGLKF